MQKNQKQFVRITYILLGTPFVGFTLTKNPPVKLWVAFACLAGILLFIKNIFFIPKVNRLRITACDIGIIALFTALLIGIPSYMGLVKSLIIAVIGGSCIGLLSWKICSG